METWKQYFLKRYQIARDRWKKSSAMSKIFKTVVGIPVTVLLINMVIEAPETNGRGWLYLYMAPLICFWAFFLASTEELHEKVEWDKPVFKQK